MPDSTTPPGITIIGSGYVGAVTGAGFAELGHPVWFVDIDPRKIQAIRDGNPSVYEPGLAELFTTNKPRIHATTTLNEAVEKTDILMICVGTPPEENGSQDVNQVKSAAAAIGRALRQSSSRHTIVIKSTVLPGTTERVITPIIEGESGMTAGNGFGIAVNPEFLQEGSAVRDFRSPDRIVIGTIDERSKNVMGELNNPFECPKIFVDLKTAEMVKFVNNAFLATKISFANEIGNICKRMGIDTREVFKAIGLDRRINPAFFRSGIGFGGSCLPKDVNALIACAGALGMGNEILRAVARTNETQPEMMLQLLRRHLPDMKHRKIGILGLSFKPGTDDIRESRAVPVIRQLKEEGAQVIAYDPHAMVPFRKIFPAIDYAASAQDVLRADAVLIITEWEEFSHLDYSGKIVIDGRRIDRARETARIYEGVCW
jgi:UDPglucose 6-dehydrogenase